MAIPEIPGFYFQKNYSNSLTPLETENKKSIYHSEKSYQLLANSKSLLENVCPLPKITSKVFLHHIRRSSDFLII